MGTQDFLPSRPPAGINFNRLLLRISKNISSEELIEIKRSLHGLGFTDTTMSGIYKMTDLFNLLRNKELLSKDNVDILKEILCLLKREGQVHELIKDTLSVLKTDPNFASPVREFEQPVGHRTVTFTFSRNSINRVLIEDLRTRVSNITFSPLCYVLVCAVTASTTCTSSMSSSDTTISFPSVSLSVPEMYAKILSEELRKQSECYKLSSIGVVSVNIEGFKPLEVGFSQDTLNVEIKNQQLLEEENQLRKNLEEELEDAYKRMYELEAELHEKREIEKSLKALEENSGMSTTLFKLTGRLDKDKNRPVNKPKKSQEDVKFESLYQRVTRIFPHIKEENLTFPYRPKIKRNDMPQTVNEQVTQEKQFVAKGI